MDRTTRKPTLIECQPPSLEQWDEYVAEVAQFFAISATEFPDLMMPDDLKELAESGNYHAWAHMTAALFRVKLFRDLVKHLFFTYLNPYIEGIDPSATDDKLKCSATEAWIRRNAPITLVTRMLVIILAIDETIKKNGIFVLTQMLQLAQVQRSSHISQPKQTSESATSRSGRHLGPNFISFDMPNTRVN